MYKYTHKYEIGVTKTLSSRDVLAILKEDGWQLVAIAGDHHQFRHPTKPGRVTVPHPRNDIALPLLRSVYRQAGLDWQRRR